MLPDKLQGKFHRVTPALASGILIFSKTVQFLSTYLSPLGAENEEFFLQGIDVDFKYFIRKTFILLFLKKKYFEFVSQNFGGNDVHF